MHNRDHEVVWDDKKIADIARAIKKSNRILVGLGGGMPMSAGMSVLPFDKKLKPEEYWPFWYPHIKEQRLVQEVPAVYTQLAQLLDGKEYFIIDSNADGFIQKSGVELGHIYKAQGDMARLQCSKNCKDQTWIGKSHFEKWKRTRRISRCAHIAVHR